MTLPTFNTAISALRDTLLDKWGAKIATVNAARYATIRSTKAQNYTVPVGGTIDISVNGAASVTVTPTEGARTAAQLVTDFDAAVTSLACNDDGGVFEIKDGTSVASADRKLQITADANGLAAALGFAIGDIAHRAPCKPLPREKFYDYEPEVIGPPPYIMLKEVNMEGEAHQKTRPLYTVTAGFSIADAYPGGSYKPTRDLVNGYAQVVREIIDENHNLGGAVVNARLSEIQVLPRLYQFEGRGPVMGEAEFTIMIRVFNA